MSKPAFTQVATIGIYCLFHSAWALADAQTRVHLSSFKITWAGKEIEAPSHLDVGIEELEAAPKNQCRILKPIVDPKVHPERPWAPLDFYTQVNKGQENQFQSGIQDYFFKGDDLNRNGDGSSYQFTRELSKNLQGSLKFDQKIDSAKRDEIELVVSFRRKNIEFDGLMRVRVWLGDAGCEGSLEYCENSSIVKIKGGKPIRVCKKGGWTHQIQQIFAIADETGYATDQAYERWFKTTIAEIERNDVFSLKAATVQTKTGAAEEITLAIKKKKKDQPTAQK